ERQALAGLAFLVDLLEAGSGQARQHPTIVPRAILAAATDANPCGPGKLGAKPTRSRHCKRGAPALQARSRTAPSLPPSGDGKTRATRDDPRVRRPATTGHRPFSSEPHRGRAPARRSPERRLDDPCPVVVREDDVSR